MHFVFLFISTSGSRGKVVDRISLPPPQYSTPKTSRSSSFCPSAPSSGRHDTTAGSAPSAASASDNHVLALFLAFSLSSFDLLHVRNLCHNCTFRIENFILL